MNIRPAMLCSLLEKLCIRRTNMVDDTKRPKRAGKKCSDADGLLGMSCQAVSCREFASTDAIFVRDKGKPKKTAATLPLLLLLLLLLLQHHHHPDHRHHHRRRRCRFFRSILVLQVVRVSNGMVGATTAEVDSLYMHVHTATRHRLRTTTWA